MDYMVDIDNFEGPLDLLLHLIKQSEMDIYNVNLAEISEQYMNYIHSMKDMNLNVASEYLVVGAELTEIKAYSLLPKHDTIEEDDYEENPEESLRNRLIEYEKYKNITSSLKEFELERQSFFSREASDLNNILDPKTDTLDENFNVDDLVNAINNMLKRKLDNKPLSTKVTTKEYSVSERSKQIKNILKQKKKVEFTELFDVFSKDYIVVTFLSILAMARDNELIIKQDKNFDRIMLEAGE